MSNATKQRATAVVPAQLPTGKESVDRVTELARDLFIRRMTIAGNAARTAAHIAGECLKDASAFWEETDSRN